MVGNKGAVAVAFDFNFTSIIFINCHLADRVLSSNNKTVSDHFDIAVWSGDFNYRIDADKTFVDYCMEDKSEFLVNSLIDYDQMIAEINNGNLKINRFTEARIKFFPTYKLVVGEDNYNTEEAIPGWTDRIIYKTNVKSFLQIKEYNWIKEIKSSDHKPVFAIFELNIPKNNLQSDTKSTKSTKACTIF